MGGFGRGESHAGLEVWAEVGEAPAAASFEQRTVGRGELPEGGDEIGGRKGFDGGEEFTQCGLGGRELGVEVGLSRGCGEQVVQSVAGEDVGVEVAFGGHAALRVTLRVMARNGSRDDTTLLEVQRI